MAVPLGLPRGKVTESERALWEEGGAGAGDDWMGKWATSPRMRAVISAA